MSGSTYQQRMAEFTRANARVQFYKSIGRPDLAQRYEPFAIPQGMKVQTIQETKKGLQVSFYDPNAKPVEQTPKAQQPTKPMDSQEALERQQFYKQLGRPELAEKYDIFAIPSGLSVHLRETSAGLEATFYDPVQRAIATDKYQKSKSFFKSIGYEKFGGRYEPFLTPEGQHIGDIQESSEGLQITFHDTAAEAKQQAEIKKSVDFFTSIGYSQFGGKYAPFDVPEGHHIGEVTEAEGSLKITFHETAAEEAYRQMMEMENPQIAGISRNWQEYLNSGGLERQAQYAQPRQTVISTLPKSDYWITTPENIGKTGPAYSGVKIVPPEGYMVTNVKQPTTVEMVGPLLPGQTRPTIEVVPYDLVPMQNKSITPKSIMESAPSQGFLADLVSGLSKTSLNLKQSLPGLGVPVADLLTPQEKSAIRTTSIAAVTVLLPVAGPIVGLSATAVATNILLGVGISQGFKYASSQFTLADIGRENKIFAEALKAEKITPSEYGYAMKFQEQRKQDVSNFLLTPTEIVESAAIGGAFSIVSAGVFKGVHKIAPTVTASIIGRTSLNAVIGAGGGYVLSGGNIEEAGKGALFGGLLSIGSEAIPAIATRIRTKMPSQTGGLPDLSLSQKTIGASGQEVPTWISEPLKEYGGKRIRVVGDVTELPVGTKGVSLSSMVDDYVGKNVPTGHATLTPEAFNLKAGGETLLKGFPEMSKGFRGSEQLYHFYSAPGSDDFITIYGGYAGIGKGYSGSSKIMFGGKPTALVTLDTMVSPEFLRIPNESQASFLSRISLLSGKTGLAPETLLGESMERQLVTPAAYSRFPEPITFGMKVGDVQIATNLPGSKFVSEGKIGTFVIKTEPTGLLGRIPILKTIFTKYQTLDVVKGKYAPTTATTAQISKTLDTVKYGSSYGRTISVSSKFAVSPSAIIKPIIPSVSKSIQSISKTVSLVSTSTSSRAKEVSKSSQISISLKPSLIKMSEPISLTSSSKSLKSTPISTSTSTSKRKTDITSGSLSLTPSFSKISSPSSLKELNQSGRSRDYSPSMAYTPSLSHTTISKQSKTSKLGLAPTFPFIGGKGKGGKDSLKGKWFKYKNPIKTPKRMLKDFQTFGSDRSARNNPLLNFSLQTKRKNQRRKR
jgi:hypothetical protein